MHTDAAKEAIRVFILDAFGEMPCRVCLEKVFDPPVYTVTKWVKSQGHGPLLVLVPTVFVPCFVDGAGGFINRQSFGASFRCFLVTLRFVF